MCRVLHSYSTPPPLSPFIFIQIAMSSVLNQTGGTKQEVEEPDRCGGSSGLLSSVVTVTVTFVSLSLVLLAINSYLEIDVPTLEDVPKRIVYIIRIHGYAAVIIPIGKLISTVSTEKHINLKWEICWIISYT